VDILRKSGLPVLVVDDDRDTADSAVLLLNYAGYQAVAAYSAAMALELANQRAPRVVLLDLAMPGQDGVTLAQKLKQLPAMENALLICITGYGQEHLHERARQAGCDHVLLKPIEWSQLLPLIDQSSKPEVNQSVS
jgi:CheY-like chemotaxis protein